MGGLAYIVIGLVVALVTTRTVHARGRRLRGGRWSFVAQTLFWPFVLGAWALALVIGVGHAWLVKNSSRAY